MATLTDAPPTWEVRQGDCLELITALPDASVDMVFCDPPYGIGMNDGDLAHNWERAFSGAGNPSAADARPHANDNAEWFHDSLPLVIAELSRVLVKGGCCCCCCGGGGGPLPIFADMTLMLDRAPGLKFKQAVVWDKGGLGMGIHYRRCYEFVLVAQRKGAACKWYDTTKSAANVLRRGKILPSAIEHPCAKPWQLSEHFMRLHSLPGDLVLDCFSGGGSTGEAAVRTGRRFLGMEIDPHWVEYSRRRIGSAQPPLVFA